MLDGKVNILTNSGEKLTLKAGQSSNFDATGALGANSICDPEALYDSILPKVDFPAVDLAFVNTKQDDLKNPFSEFPIWAIIIFIVVALLLLITLVYMFRRFIAALFIAPSIALFLLILGRLVVNSKYTESIDFATHLMLPWEAFQLYTDWISAVAWLVGSIIAGLVLKSGIKGFVGGLFFPLVPWFFFYFFKGMSMPNNMGILLDMITQYFTASPVNLIVLMCLTALGGLIGGIVSPRKKARGISQSKNSRKKAALKDYDDGVYDTDYDDDYVIESDDYDDD